MQYVTVPVSMPYLHFWYQIDSDDWCNYDYGYVRVNETYEKTLDFVCTTILWVGQKQLLISRLMLAVHSSLS
ncbi:MAG: hypothetical protein XD73_1029 [Anaerolinea thermophila]|uniref:Uncharacterized protein n=1 Tax=Anaerolinea thermophila TaxID=167964 RepID=A0A101FXC7_9CHLR|nr:MAG: hypothetical protein XD73_1029 [Anaerolinea thermophila]